MAEPVDWWEKHFPRIKELNDLRKIAEILKIETNPELSKRCFLSSTKVECDSSFKRVQRNIETNQRRYEHLQSK